MHNTQRASGAVRRTLRRPAAVRGVGLFTGRAAGATILPARAGTGLVFVRADLPGRPHVAAVAENISAGPVHPAFARLAPRSTNLGPPGAPPLVATCEHVLSALAGLGVSDAVIELDGPELPIGDGSAGEFADAIGRAGTEALEGGVEPLRLDDPVRVEDGSGGVIDALPAAAAGFVYELDYGPGSPIPPRSATWDAGPAEYRDQVASARTFCLREEAEAMRALGLFAHFSARDLLVFGPDGPIENALRSENEPARHKLLDLIGDLALVGRPVQARIIARRSGHALNHALARLLRGVT